MKTIFILYLTILVLISCDFKNKSNTLTTYDEINIELNRPKREISEINEINLKFKWKEVKEVNNKDYYNINQYKDTANYFEVIHDKKKKEVLFILITVGKTKNKDVAYFVVKKKKKENFRSSILKDSFFKCLFFSEHTMKYEEEVVETKVLNEYIVLKLKNTLYAFLRKEFF